MRKPYEVIATFTVSRPRGPEFRNLMKFSEFPPFSLFPRFPRFSALFAISRASGPSRVSRQEELLPRHRGPGRRRQRPRRQILPFPSRIPLQRVRARRSSPPSLQFLFSRTPSGGLRLFNWGKCLENDLSIISNLLFPNPGHVQEFDWGNNSHGNIHFSTTCNCG